MPEIPSTDSCSEQQYDEDVGLPRNVTRRSDLPPTNYKLIAIAPFFKKECTKAYLKATRFHSVRAFIFYKANNFTNKPPEVDNPTWDLDDGGAWIEENQFPIFAIPGADGQNLVNRLSKYSGMIEEAPHGQEIIDIYGPNPRDYIRIWAELTLKDSKSLPALWTFFVIVIGSLLVIITFISIFLHMVQRRRRKNLYERVKAGEVDLEVEGIARVHVPEPDVKAFPVFTFQLDPERMSEPPTPGSAPVTAPRSARTSRHGDRSILSVITPASRARTNLTSDMSTAANNRQYACHLCEDPFENKKTIIRELPCGHIFHPECIDEYLLHISSLCPVCRTCMLPVGYAPRITNGMVRRERAMRRVKGRVSVSVEMEPTDDGRGKIGIFPRNLFKDKDGSAHEIPLSPIASPKADKEKVSPEKIPLPPSNTPSPAPTTNTPPPTDDAAAAHVPASSIPTAGREEKTAAAAEAQPESQPPRTRTKRPRRSRASRLALSKAPDSMAQLDHQLDGRKSPTPATKARMKQIADDVDPKIETDRPMCMLSTLLASIDTTNAHYREESGQQGVSGHRITTVGGVKYHRS